MTTVLTLALLAVAACAGDPAPAPMETDTAAADTTDALPYVYVEAGSSGLRAELAVNGFPITTLEGGTYQSAENPYFIGEGNRLTIRLLPPTEGPNAEGTAAEGPQPGIRFHVTVRRYPVGYQGWLGADGELLAETNIGTMIEAERARLQAAFDSVLAAAPTDGARARLLADSERHLALRYPIETVLTFDTADLPSFRAELFEREPVDREAVLDYAMRLRDLIRARDIDALVTETQPKMDWGNRALPQEYEPDYRAMFERIFAKEEVQADFTREQVVAVPVHGGRLWQLSVRRPPYVDPETEEASPEPEAFVYTLDPETGRSSTFSMTVGMDNGRLRVVR